jgi:hypothetical protein
MIIYKLYVRIVSHVTSSVFKILVKIKVTVQVTHRLFQVVYDVSDICIHVLIVRSVGLIV